MQDPLSTYLLRARAAGCPADQVENFTRAGLVLQPRQLAASAAARLCDAPDGPTGVGYGGARGGGKSYWLLAQMGADDCQRCPGLKCLLLRKCGKSNQENFDDLRRRVFRRLEHDFSVASGLVFPNGSRILARHYQTESEIDALLGLEYDVIGIEEATTLTQRKLEDLATCARTSKPGWRPRIYSTTNPGGVGHEWYYRTFIIPYQRGRETDTRFIPARVSDNHFLNPDYRKVLAACTGWRKDAWCDGKWEIAAGQFFRNFHPAVHVIGGRPEPAGLDGLPLPASPPVGMEPRAGEGRCVNQPAALPNPHGSPSPPPGERAAVRELASDFERRQFLEELTRLRRFRESDAVEWFAAMDYGYTHLTVVLLGCHDHAGNLYVLDEHAARFGIVQAHARAIKAMLARHRIYLGQQHLRESLLEQYPDHSQERENLWRAGQRRMLARFVAGGDVFGRESSGLSVADQYRQHGLTLRPANTDRVAGWSAVLDQLGDPAAGILPRLFIHHRCERLIAGLPQLLQDPDRPGDVLKTDINDEGEGGDDAGDCLRYLVATPARKVHVRQLVGL